MTPTAADPIFQPLTINGLRLKNRIVRCSIGGRADFYDGSMSEARIAWERRFALVNRCDLALDRNDMHATATIDDVDERRNQRVRAADMRGCPDNQSLGPLDERFDEEAAEIVGGCFPDRELVGVPAREILLDLKRRNTVPEAYSGD